MPVTMDEEEFFNQDTSDMFLDGTLTSADHDPFSVLPNVTPSSLSHVDETPHWWSDNFHLEDLESSFELNGVPSDDLQHVSPASHERMLYKDYFNAHVVQPPYQADFMAVPSTSNVPSRAMNPWLGFTHRQSLGNPSIPEPYKNSLFYEQPQYINVAEAQHMSAFHNNNNDISLPSMLSTAQFTTADLGKLSQPTAADDTVSLAYTQASCNSRCTSSVCENENCSVTGIPCDDPTCVDNDPLVGTLELGNQTLTQFPSGPVTFHPPHAQPCSHTESEHLVARTLGELRAPAETDAPEKPLFVSQFEYHPSMPYTPRQFYPGQNKAYPNPSHPSTETKSFLSNEGHISTPSLPPQLMTPDSASNPERHICHWAAHSEKAICGAEFSTTKDFHDHLCEIHIDRLSSQTGFACLWDGCPRSDRPFVTRGKLRRHVSTHSVYKPFTCDICKQGFSGQQALQQHERIHTGLKPFKCTFEGCTMAFKQKSALTMHSRVHTGEKPLQCEYCGKAFPESSNLSKHRKIHLVKSDKYICEDIVKGEPCNRSFRRLDQLRRHRQTHLNPGKRKAAHARSTSIVSSVSGEMV